MEYKDCVKKYKEYLSVLPSDWAEIIACNICDLSCKEGITCEEIRDCQTLTELSSFSLVNNRVCIIFKDERGISIKRCFDFPLDEINDTDGSCITDDWGDLTSTEKWQAIIDNRCECCEPTTTSTTTTTTKPPCVCATYSVYNPSSEIFTFNYVGCPPDENGEDIPVPAGGTVVFCACYSDGDPTTAYVADSNLFVTYLGDGCDPDSTSTTTTTTSTTTTSTTTSTTTTTTTTSTSTSTTTTANPCECHSYTVENNTDEAIVGSYDECTFPYDTIGFALGAGVDGSFCACEGSVIVPVSDDIIVTDNGLC